MNRTLLAALLGTVALAGTAAARPELNAFINRPANTIPELISQLRSDPVVMDRFMRHFSMTRSEVLSYVGSLRLGTIPNTGYYNVYSVPEDGRIKVHKSYFKAGTPAFVNAQGQPVLRIKCGNPFVAGPKLVASTTPQGPIETTTELQPIEVADVVPAPPEITSVIPPPEVAELPVADVPGPVAPTTPSFEPASPQIFSAAPLAALAGLGAAISFGGSGRDRPGTPVPEPATMLALGAGAAVLIRRRKK